jgi:hypothetical protein
MRLRSTLKAVDDTTTNPAGIRQLAKEDDMFTDTGDTKRLQGSSLDKRPALSH